MGALHVALCAAGFFVWWPVRSPTGVGRGAAPDTRKVVHGGGGGVRGDEQSPACHRADDAAGNAVHLECKDMDKRYGQVIKNKVGDKGQLELDLTGEGKTGSVVNL